ncbi:MAG: UbiA family prenyltransferase [Marinifilaceae bacterium]|nr:UbiA family prenyltransferase [Marinifilaceae bacterium]
MSKPLISLSTSATGVLGYVVYTKSLSSFPLILFLGVLFLVMSGSVINQIIERSNDSLMFRTCERPLVSRRIGYRVALLYASMLILISTFLIYYQSGIISLCFSYLGLIWYISIYTWLKKITAFAVVPGAVCGIMPIYIFWQYASGQYFSYDIFIICMLFLFLQIPHFWLIQQKYSSDYKNAGFQILNNIFSNIQIKTIIAVWIISSLILSLLLVVFGLVGSLVFIASIFLVVFVFFISSIYCLVYSNYSKLFNMLNVFSLLIMLIVLFDNILVL